MAGTLAVAALAVGSNLGGLHVSELHTKLIVIGLAVVFAIFGLVTARSTANPLVRAAHHASIATTSTTRVLCLLLRYLVVFLSMLGADHPSPTTPRRRGVDRSDCRYRSPTTAVQPFAGLVLLITRPLAVGRSVRIHFGALGGPLEGSVIEMGLIYSTLSTEHKILHIPTPDYSTPHYAHPPPPNTPADQDGLTSNVQHHQ